MLRQTLPLFVFLGLLAPTACDDEDEPKGARVDDILALDGDSTNGETVFATCATAGCHGAGGTGGPGPSLAEGVGEHSDGELVNVIILGEGSMPAQSQLSDQQVADVLAYLRDTFE
jgi:cytochrome c551